MNDLPETSLLFDHRHAACDLTRQRSPPLPKHGLVRDVTEILTSLCARLYGRRAAANRARRAVEAVTEDPT
jgi:predicted site-specific integrase-resolvase